MQKIIIYLVSSLVIVGGLIYILNLNQVEAAPVEHDVTMTTDVLEYITMDISGPAADTIAFGNLTPLTPKCYATGTVATVSTNAAHGYTIGIDDNTAAPNSSMAQGGVYIPKMTNGTIAVPVTWGANTGVGISMYAADTTKEAAWGTGVTVCDADNKYAAIPEAATLAHTAHGSPVVGDTSSWSYQINVANTQATGAYSGTMTFTATAVLI